MPCAASRWGARAMWVEEPMRNATRRKRRRRRESVRPSMVSPDDSASRQDDRFGQLGEAGIEGELAHGGLAAHPVQVRLQLLEARVELALLELELSDVVGRRRDLYLLGEREEHQHERDDDRAQRQG